ncbi:hypothetical protein DFR50_107164 [Roseiarcus fermentans]|uniref:Uncharacterized protein n=1 Tax=Roseiarcus fermentans TaxID=1473586 RepID=A0A366FMI1_9HYPH|nr:hypothetical protein DFR50_107164 [Roseiarcus fermentans]
MSDSNTQRNRALLFLMLANVSAVSLFLYFGSQLWAPPGQEGLWGGPGDPILWTFLAFPWLFVGALANIVVIPRIVAEVYYNRDLPLLLI